MINANLLLNINDNTINYALSKKQLAVVFKVLNLYNIANNGFYGDKGDSDDKLQSIMDIDEVIRYMANLEDDNNKLQAHINDALNLVVDDLFYWE